MRRYTRGPWTLTHVSGSNFAIQKFEIRGVLFGEPNVSPIFNKDNSAIDGAAIYCSPEDASLIAAAPELLETLSALVEHCRQMGFTTREEEPLLESADAIIAKATRSQP